MTNGKQHLRFSVELWSKAGHESLLSHFEGELRHLEHAREYLNKRAKVELDYATALGKISAAASKFITDSDHESPIKKAWCTFIMESEKKSKMITDFANCINSTTIQKLEQLIEDKRNLLKKYRTERFKIESSFKQETDEIDRLKKTYQDNAKESESGKRKYEDAVQKEKFHSKEWEKSKDKYVKTTLKLHQNHNDYVLAITSGNCHGLFFKDVLVPKMLNSVQYLQEEYVAEWKDILQETVDLTNCCREEFQSSSHLVQSGIDEASKEQEYMEFIYNNRENPAPAHRFMFDSELVKLTSSGVTASMLVVNDLTLEKLQHKKTLLSKDLEIVLLDLESKEKELEQETNVLQEGKKSKKDTFSILQQEQAVAVVNWNIEQLKCNQSKLQKMCSQIGAALDRLGNNQPPKFADLSVPSASPIGERGQLTPELRRSGKRITTLFKKKERVGKESTSFENVQGAGKTAVYEPQNGIPDGFPDNDECLGEYIEPDDDTPVEEEAWFYGTIDRKDVTALLKNDGDFLVRESGTKRGQFVLSSFSSGQIRHFIIQNTEDGCVRFEDQGFPSIKMLLNYHRDQRIPVTKKSLAILVNPVLKDKWELSRDDIMLDRKLGQGHFGDVMKGYLKPSNMPIAVKSCKESVTETVKRKFLAEAEILKQYSHPNIVRLIGVCAEKEPVFIVMEFMPGGDFLAYLRKTSGKVNEKRLLKFSIDAASGMEYLASKNCIHRDLAARNCLIGEGDLLKISDFGMSREVEEVYEASNMKEIPVKWTAPEALNYTIYTIQSDIWSFGVLLWETFSLGNQPYPGFSNKQTREKVDAGYRMAAPSGTPPAVHQIMKDCWNADPQSRPSFSEILRRLKQVCGVL